MNEIENIIRNLLRISIAVMLVYASVRGLSKITRHRHSAQARTAPTPARVDYMLNKIAADNAASAPRTPIHSIPANFAPFPASDSISADYRSQSSGLVVQ